MDAAQIPQDKEAENIRINTSQRISGEVDKIGMVRNQWT